MADEKKVFDVAKPGSSKPDMGSKPMVVGHKIMKDPTLTSSDDEQNEKIAPQPNKITINPISHDEDLEQVASNEDNPPEKSEVSAQASTTEQNETAIEATPDTVDENQAVETVEEKQAAADIEEADHEENLQRIIKEKTYNVPIEEASYSAFKTFAKTFLAVAIIGIIVVIILVDAEIIDFGIKLPFDVL